MQSLYLPSDVVVDFVGPAWNQRAGIINLAQRFSNRGGIDRYSAGLCIGVDAIENQRLDIAVKNDPDEFVRLVYDRAAAVAADDVCVGNKIEMCRQIEICLLVDPALRQIERWFVVVLGRALI